MCAEAIVKPYVVTLRTSIASATPPPPRRFEAAFDDPAADAMSGSLVPHEPLRRHRDGVTTGPPRVVTHEFVTVLESVYPPAHRVRGSRTHVVRARGLCHQPGGSAMRTTMLTGGVLVVAAVLIVMLSSSLGLDVESVALMGASIGAVIALVPHRTPTTRLIGFLVGFVASWFAYLARAGFLP